MDNGMVIGGSVAFTGAPQQNQQAHMQPQVTQWLSREPAPHGHLTRYSTQYYAQHGVNGPMHPGQPQQQSLPTLMSPHIPGAYMTPQQMLPTALAHPIAQYPTQHFANPAMNVNSPDPRYTYDASGANASSCGIVRERDIHYTLARQKNGNHLQCKYRLEDLWRDKNAPQLGDFTPLCERVSERWTAVRGPIPF